MSALNVPTELAERLSPVGQRLASDIIAAEDREDRPVVTRKEAARMLGIKQTRLIVLEQTGAIRSFLEGVSRKITTTSIYAYLLARVVATHPATGEPAKRPTPKRQGRPARRRPAKRERVTSISGAKHQRELSVVKP
jgi:hypothetical protein